MFVCKRLLYYRPPDFYPIAVNKYIILNVGTVAILL